jgi:hypothetical protein
MTIDIDGIETVIRKDNCKVQAFGTMVRITDYKGSIYEFLYSDCTAPSQPNANALRDAIEAFLNTGGGGGGGGITTITSIDGSIDIDLSNPNAPDLSLQNGSFTPTFSNELNCTPDFLKALYSRVGNVVTVSYYLGIELDATFTTGGFNVSIPIPSTFATARDAFGVITPITDPYSKLVSATIGADTATNKIGFIIVLNTAGETLTFVANIQYLIS